MSPDLPQGVPGKRTDLTGARFGSLIANEPAYKMLSSGRRMPAWRLVCDCGNEVVAMTVNLTKGKHQSCGCERVARGVATKAANPEPRKPSPFEDLTGRQFGRLTVLRRTDQTLSSGRRMPAWDCMCECGTETNVLTVHLKAGRSKSCGCLAAEIASASHTTHGLSKTLIYGVWKSMINRCYRPAVRGYKHYGGRGISVCDRWLDSFENFFADMGEPPPKHSIDRINVNGNYEPGNCRWATASEQALNKRPRKRKGPTL